MAEEQFTEEETAALADMQSEETQETQEVDGKAPDEDRHEETAHPKEPEFKTTRKEEWQAPDWSSLSTEQKDTIQRVLNGKPPPGYVPHGALHQTREELKELRAALEAQKSQEKPEEQAPEYRDPIEDPEGFRKWAEYQNQQARKPSEEVRQRYEEQQRVQQRVQRATQLEQEFATKTPDYPDAVNWLHQQRVGELQAQGYGEAEIAEQIRKDANGIFDAAEAAGMNPAEILYYRARSAGFQPEQKQDAVKQEGERIEAQARAQKQTQGLGSGGGDAQRGKLTPEILANMSEREFAKLSEDQIREAMGG